MSRATLLIGSRGSELALWQAKFVQEILETKQGLKTEIKIIKTSGDRIDDLAFEKMEGKGFFTKELEDALLSHEIDIAVHSLKDLMTTQPDGLKLGAVGFRADRREMLLIRKTSRIDDGFIPVKSGGILGTSSNRRKCQVAHHNPNLEIRDLRGNVPTRVGRLRDGKYDAIIIAAAGVTRLNLDLSDLEVVLLDPEIFLPAPGQGILGIQIRDDDADVERVISHLGSARIAVAAALERGLLSQFDSGCSLPLGVYSEANGKDLRLAAVLGTREGGEWTGLRRIDVSGTESVRLIKDAYAALTGRNAECA